MADSAHYDLDDPGLLLRPDVVEDPRPLYDLLRRRAPVWQIPGQDSYLVVDPALIREAVGRTSEFSSNLVSVLHRGDDGQLAAFAMTPLGDPTNVLATADPPVHSAQRKLLQPHLSPAALAPLEPTIRDLVDHQLEPMLSAGRGDAVASVSDLVPALAICLLVGLPHEDAADLVPMVGNIGLLLDGVTELDGMGDAALAALNLISYVEAQFDSSRDRPADERTGLMAVLVDALDRGVLTRGDALGILMQLLNAGTETTSSLIATTIELLARQPDLQEELRREPARIPETLEGVLRNDGPFQFHYRWSTTDATLGEVMIPANSRVLMMWAAANRPAPTSAASGDDDADREGPHFAFGRGLHFCIGAPLARLESRVVIEQLLGRTCSFSLDEQQPPTRRPSFFLRRHASLPVVVERA
jgi:cytochrome P450